MTDKKYILTNDKIIVAGKTLYRIKAVKSFGDVVVGTLGGYVEFEYNLSHDDTAWIAGDAIVTDNARVFGDAKVSGDAVVSDNVWVFGRAWVSGTAKVSGDVWVNGDALVFGSAVIGGSEQVFGKMAIG